MIKNNPLFNVIVACWIKTMTLKYVYPLWTISNVIRVWECQTKVFRKSSLCKLRMLFRENLARPCCRCSSSEPSACSRWRAPSPLFLNAVMCASQWEIRLQQLHECPPQTLKPSLEPIREDLYWMLASHWFAGPAATCFSCSVGSVLFSVTCWHVGKADLWTGWGSVQFNASCWMECQWHARKAIIGICLLTRRHRSSADREIKHGLVEMDIVTPSKTSIRKF